MRRDLDPDTHAISISRMREFSVGTEPADLPRMEPGPGKKKKRKQAAPKPAPKTDDSPSDVLLERHGEHRR
jgi:hypothetical protein